MSINSEQRGITVSAPDIVSPKMKTRKRLSGQGGQDESLSGVLMAAVYEVHPKTPLRLTARSGTVNLNHNGFGFVTEDDGESFFIRAPLARSLLSGDVIRFSVTEQAKSSSPEVQRISWITRDESILMCEVQDGPVGLRLVPDDPCFVPLQLAADDQPKIQLGDVVAIRIPAFEGAPSLAPLQVSLHQNLGPRKASVEFHANYAQVKFGFDKLADESLLDDDLVERAKPSAELGEDTTPYVTIDGASTQDFDDAVFARKRSDGTWTVRIAIADVSWFVQPGSQLDAWAAKQCTSVYLPGSHVPMLPPQLSIDLCSLKEGELRRAVVLSLHLSEAGEVLESRVERRQIRSNARLTYTQVTKFLSGKTALRFSGDVESNLLALEEVYNLLAQRRRQAGVLDLEEPDPQMVKGEDGTWKLVWESRTVAHKLIEELMLLANRVAAEILVSRYGAGLFRLQPAPEPKAWEDLREWALVHGHEMPGEPSLKAIVSLVNAQAEVGADAQLNAFFKVRTVMKPARYVVQTSETPGGHFSLSMDWYTHFTSPIRRYADLLVHRLLLAPEDAEIAPKDLEALAELVARCSEQAQKARLAERSVWDRLKLQCLTDSVPRTEQLKARVLRSTARGVRMILAGWQCSAWLLADTLRAAGYSFSDGVWRAADAESGTPEIQEGTMVSVQWKQISHALPAYPELQVTI